MYLYQIYIFLLGHLHIFLPFFFAFMENLFKKHPIHNLVLSCFPFCWSFETVSMRWQQYATITLRPMRIKKSFRGYQLSSDFRVVTPSDNRSTLSSNAANNCKASLEKTPSVPSSVRYLFGSTFICPYLYQPSNQHPGKHQFNSSASIALNFEKKHRFCKQAVVTIQRVVFFFQTIIPSLHGVLIFL